MCSTWQKSKAYPWTSAMSFTFFGGRFCHILGHGLAPHNGVNSYPGRQVLHANTHKMRKLVTGQYIFFSLLKTMESSIQASEYT